MTVGSLFSGVGGFDLGLERAGHEVVWQVEAGKQCRSVLRRHWPDVDLYEDVCDVGSDQLAPVDLICGGFPCQDLSVAGNRAGLDGARSGLWFEFHRIVAECAPTWVLIENVPGLLSSDGGRDMAVIVRGLAELGYVGAWRVLDSQHFGVAQRRRRIFLLACNDPRAGCAAEILAIPEGVSGHPTPSTETRERITPSVTAGAPFSSTGINERVEADALVRAPMVVGPLAARDFKGVGSQYVQEGKVIPGVLAPDTANPLTARMVKGANTVTGHGTTSDTVAFNIYPAAGQGADLEASETALGNLGGRYASSERGTRVVDGLAPRRLTPRECERLQGFPDDWTRWDEEGVELKDGPRYRIMGNAVTVNVAEWIGRRILEHGDNG